MNERITSTPEQIVEFQAIELLNNAKTKGFNNTSWDTPQIKEALSMFRVAIERTKPLAAYAEIGTCHQMDECDDICELPNTLTVIPVFEKYDLERDAEWYEETLKWLDREDSDIRRADSDPYHVWAGRGARDNWEQDFSEANLVKIYPL